MGLLASDPRSSAVAGETLHSRGTATVVRTALGSAGDDDSTVLRVLV